MATQLVLCLGTGQCGFQGFVDVLNRQPDCRFKNALYPGLPWEQDSRPVVRQRLERILSANEGVPFCGDTQSSYLPYVEEILQLVPNVKFVCLRRPKREVIQSFCQFMDRNSPLRMNHWTREPAPGWHHDPVQTRLYPKYPTQNRDEGLSLYCDQYEAESTRLAERYPEQFRLFDPEIAFDTEAGLRQLLTFVGIPYQKQQLCTGRWKAFPWPEPDLPRERPMAPRPSPDPNDPRRCVILVPFHYQIVPACEDGLKELERRGYPVRRIGGYAAIDQGRNQIATDALLDGFEETFWIDADMGFHPDAVDRIRSHQLPMVTGMAAQKGRRAMASHILPGTEKMTFGEGGGLYEILYAGAGFLHIRRDTYLKVMRDLKLPICNERFGSCMIPFFHPKLHAIEDGTWYLAEDYSFAERCQSCGIKIYADTVPRIWHFGNYAYGWEEAGRDVERYKSFTLNFRGEKLSGSGSGAEPRE